VFRSPWSILAVEFEQVECEVKRRRFAAVAADEVEDGNAFVIADDSPRRPRRSTTFAVYFLPLGSAFAFICASSLFSFSIADLRAAISARAEARSRSASAILSCVSRASLINAR